jgi:hypothetical protein
MRKACIAYWQCRRAVGKIWGLSPKVAIHFRGEANSFVCFAGKVEESGAEKCSEMALSLAAIDVFGNYWWYAFNTNACFKVIKQEARQAANRLPGSGCSYVPKFGHSEVLIKMTDEMPLLLAPRDKFATLKIFGRKFSVHIPTRQEWSTECVDLVASDGFVFFTDGSLCEGRDGASVFSDILNVR